jgi:hypothetical protein
MCVSLVDVLAHSVCDRQQDALKPALQRLNVLVDDYVKLLQQSDSGVSEQLRGVIARFVAEWRGDNARLSKKKPAPATK